MITGPGEVVLDTNVFVAAGFNRGSHSARLVEAVRDGRLRMVNIGARLVGRVAGRGVCPIAEQGVEEGKSVGNVVAMQMHGGRTWALLPGWGR